MCYRHFTGRYVRSVSEIECRPVSMMMKVAIPKSLKYNTTKIDFIMIEIYI
jgi:hypothetical protein